MMEFEKIRSKLFWIVVRRILVIANTIEFEHNIGTNLALIVL
jgi:acyl-ACP thioesterase